MKKRKVYIHPNWLWSIGLSPIAVGTTKSTKKKKKKRKRKKQAQCDKREYTKLIKYICIMTNHTLWTQYNLIYRSGLKGEPHDRSLSARIKKKWRSPHMIFYGYGNSHPWRKIRVVIMAFSYTKRFGKYGNGSTSRWQSCALHTRRGITERALRVVSMVQF